MAGSVFGKIAERVYAKDLRFDIRSAIDSTTNVIPPVKAGEMNEALLVLNDLKVPVQKQFSEQKGERAVGTYTSCSGGSHPAGPGTGFGHCAQRSRHGGERCRLPFREQGTESKTKRRGAGEKPVHSKRQPDSERTNHNPDTALRRE